MFNTFIIRLIIKKKHVFIHNIFVLYGKQEFFFFFSLSLKYTYIQTYVRVIYDMVHVLY